MDEPRAPESESESESESGSGSRSNERAVFKVVIKGPIEAVWREITKTDSVQKAMFNMRTPHAPA